MKRAILLPSLLLVVSVAVGAGVLSGQTEPTITIPETLCCGNCDCYWTYVEKDCPKNQRCNRQKTCNYREPKPGGKPGQGCDNDTEATNKCDGVCEPNDKGSFCGAEDRLLVAQFIQLWGAAFNEPALNGGGATNQALTSQARALPFVSPYCAEDLANIVTDLLNFCRGEDFLIHPDHGHTMEEHLTIDISDDPCRIESGNLCLEALTAGLSSIDAVDGYMSQIGDWCAGNQFPFSPPCARANALDCATSTVREAATLLTTVRAVDPIESLLQADPRPQRTRTEE